MVDKNIFKTAIEISKILGISDRTITRWGYVRNMWKQYLIMLKFL
jgi:hypothetical protein